MGLVYLIAQLGKNYHNGANFISQWDFRNLTADCQKERAMSRMNFVQLLKIIKQLNDGHMEGTDVTIHMSFLFWEIPAYVFFIFCQKLKTC